MNRTYLHIWRQRTTILGKKFRLELHINGLDQQIATPKERPTALQLEKSSIEESPSRENKVETLVALFRGEIKKLRMNGTIELKYSLVVVLEEMNSEV